MKEYYTNTYNLNVLMKNFLNALICVCVCVDQELKKIVLGYLKLLRSYVYNYNLV